MVLDKVQIQMLLNNEFFPLSPDIVEGFASPNFGLKPVRDRSRVLVAAVAFVSGFVVDSLFLPVTEAELKVLN